MLSWPDRGQVAGLRGESGWLMVRLYTQHARHILTSAIWLLRLDVNKWVASLEYDPAVGRKFIVFGDGDQF